MRRKAFLLSVAILAIFAAVIAGVTLRLRGHIRGQMLSQSGPILHATAHFEAARAGGAPLDFVLGMVDIKGVIALRFYSPELEPIAYLPGRLIAPPLPRTRLDALRGAEHVTTLEPRVRLGTLFEDPDGVLSAEEVPVLRVVVNLDDTEAQPLRGYAEFFLDGLPVAEALRSLDRELLVQSLTAFAVGGAAVLAVLLASLRRLEKKNREMAEANRELIRNARSAAIGAVSAHLVHGLRHAVADLETEPSGARLQAMIQEILDVIQEDTRGLAYALSAEEVAQFAADKLRDAAGRCGVTLRVHAERAIRFTNRQGNLLILALQNLLQNAVEASPAGAAVEARIARDGRQAICTVRDTGPGIPADRAARLFEGGYSSKPRGSGLGLSISRQLCRILGGDLRLAEPGPGGTVFEIRVPIDPATGS